MVDWACSGMISAATWSQVIGPVWLAAITSYWNEANYNGDVAAYFLERCVVSCIMHRDPLTASKVRISTTAFQTTPSLIAPNLISGSRCRPQKTLAFREAPGDQRAAAVAGIISKL